MERASCLPTRGSSSTRGRTTWVLEHYDIQPVRLNRIRPRRKARSWQRASEARPKDSFREPQAAIVGQDPVAARQVRGWRRHEGGEPREAPLEIDRTLMCGRTLTRRHGSDSPPAMVLTNCSSRTVSASSHPSGGATLTQPLT